MDCLAKKLGLLFLPGRFFGGRARVFRLKMQLSTIGSFLYVLGLLVGHNSAPGTCRMRLHGGNQSKDLFRALLFFLRRSLRFMTRVRSPLRFMIRARGPLGSMIRVWRCIGEKDTIHQPTFVNRMTIRTGPGRSVDNIYSESLGARKNRR